VLVAVIMMRTMNVTIGLTEARERLTEILERVLEGERMVVTRYGSPVAAIVPVPPEADGEQPLGLAAFAGAGAGRGGLYPAVSEVVALRAVARDREPPEAP
jgi:prevent-host-death family protein